MEKFLFKSNAFIEVYPRLCRSLRCGVDAVIENFFVLLKSELLYLQKFESPEQFEAELIEYPDYCNNRRIKAKRKGLSAAMHRQALLTA